MCQLIAKLVFELFYSYIDYFVSIVAICIVSDDSQYKQGRWTVLSTTVSEKEFSTDKKWLYCGYCNIQCLYPAGLVKHCKLDRHKCAVFADSGRDVFEPPPAKKHGAGYG